PRIGAAGMICLAVLGQVTASLLLDQYGVLQAPKPVDGLRLLGALLVLAGVVLVVAPWRAVPAAQAGAGQARAD
ncbi:MAG: DMT family transporter, partial [Thermomonas sp.]